MAGEYEYNEERQEIRMNCINCVFGPSIEDYDIAMAITIDKLMEVRKPVRIVLAEAREHEYDFSESKLLLEVAIAIDRIMKEVISIKNVVLEKCRDDAAPRYQFLQQFVNDARYDPIDAYKSLLREIRHTHIKIDRELDITKQCLEHYLQHTLLEMQRLFDNCEMIRFAKDRLTDHKKRKLYRVLFHPTVRPNFMYTHYMTLPPANGELIERYRVGDSEVEIYRIKGKLRKAYHLIPPEFRLQEEEYTLLDTARRMVGSHEPRETELSDPQRVRENLYRIGLDMLRDLSRSGNLKLVESRLKELAGILTRYTAGLGTMELLLEDENIQDIYVNSPVGAAPVYIYHGVHQECETNIIPSHEDAESWATRFRLQSGRPLDEANPVLDTELSAPGGRARVAAITRTLSPEGLGFALRRHRDKPWTFPLFINNRMIDPFSAGLLWFIIDGARTLLVAGTRSSGKTAFLGACMAQIMPKIRIISVEDSVTGDTRIVYQRNGKIEKSTVSKLIDDLIGKHGCEYDFGREVLRKNTEKIKVFSIGKDGKIRLSDVSSFVRHMTRKDIFEITTRTGRKIKVTGDHSLFTLGQKGEIKPAKARELKIDDYLATPRILPFEGSSKENIDVFDYLDDLQKGYFTGPDIEGCIRSNWTEIKEKIKNRGKRSYWRRKKILPVSFVKEFAKKYAFGQDIYYKSAHKSRPLPRFIPLKKEIMEFFGLWLADGCYDKKSVIISVVDEGSRTCVRKIAEEFGINVKMHSDGISLMLNSSTLKRLMEILGFKGDAYTKKVPGWVYSLDKEKAASLLKGLFSGDGYITDHEIGISLSSEELMKDIQTMLLRFGIILRIHNFQQRDKTFPSGISALHSLKAFNEIGFFQKNKMEKLQKLCNKKSTHDSTDIVPLSEEFKRLINENSENFNYQDYISRGNNIGRQKLLTIATKVKSNILASQLAMLAESDIFWDQIREIRRLEDKEQYVYDFSVPNDENFICENLLAHNTIELPIEQLRELGYNIERLKSRSVITRVETELPAEEALRTALRLGDSALIVGEVRSTEALALYEAMRIGALANVVAGTIHGDSAYGVFDRIVNDLRVPTTSFKATDIIVIVNMLRSPDGLTSFRRVVELTEVRKHWKSDPLDEGGFVNLLEYSAKDDVLKPTKTLLTGESQVLNDIASRTREWKGNWDSVWENINLRAKILQSIVDYSKAKNNAEILEAQAVIESNSMFHLISNEVKEETGTIDSKLVYEKWYSWLRKNY